MAQAITNSMEMDDGLHISSMQVQNHAQDYSLQVMDDAQ
jgi:hypothetical protein